MNKLDIMYSAYLDAIDFTDCSEDDPEMYNSLGFSSELILHAKIACEKFLSIVGDKLPDGLASQAGHDLWLTRNGHGAGFWGRPEIYGEDLADYFTSLCHWREGEFREVYTYVGDDNLIYIMGGE